MQTFGALEWDPDALITEGCDPELAQLTKTPERVVEEEQSTAEKEAEGEVQAEQLEDKEKELENHIISVKEFDWMCDGVNKDYDIIFKGNGIFIQYRPLQPEEKGTWKVIGHSQIQMLFNNSEYILEFDQDLSEAALIRPYATPQGKMKPSINTNKDIEGMYDTARVSVYGGNVITVEIPDRPIAKGEIKDNKGSIHFPDEATYTFEYDPQEKTINMNGNAPVQKWVKTQNFSYIGENAPEPPAKQNTKEDEDNQSQIQNEVKPQAAEAEPVTPEFSPTPAEPCQKVDEKAESKLMQKLDQSKQVMENSFGQGQLFTNKHIWESNEVYKTQQNKAVNEAAVQEQDDFKQQMLQHMRDTQGKQQLEMDAAGQQLEEREMTDESGLVAERAAENSQQFQTQMIQQQKKVLNYREFLSRIVKFRQVVEFSPNSKKADQNGHGSKHDQEDGKKASNSQNDVVNVNSSDDEVDGVLIGTGFIDAECAGPASQNKQQHSGAGIEERIHINYRLQYLRDSVMARYIDDQTVSVINQLITTNNREIVVYVFEPNQPRQSIEYADFAKYGSQASIKDQIVEKIKCKTDMKSRHQAIEFMIELCQILKNLSFQPGGLCGSGVGSFIYSSGQMGSSMNSRQLYEQLNQVNFIGLLAETFSILVPNEETLMAHLNKTEPNFHQHLLDIYKKQLGSGEVDQEDQDDKVSILNDLIEFKNEKNTFDEDVAAVGNPSGPSPTSLSLLEQRNRSIRLDSMKINSMEIILSFQQMPNDRMSSINKFLLCSEQHQLGYPFMKQLVNHLIYTPELGLKIQIADFFKAIFDGDQNQMNNVGIKDIFYREILFRGSLKFLQVVAQIKTNLDGPKYEGFQPEVLYEVYKSYEFSAYLILQILNKVVAEHRYPLTVKIQENNVIKIVAELQKLNSQILNLEIVKFYKALLRSKNYGYLLMIMRNDLFDPIYRIFEEAYHPRNPPMIYSCIRDLFEMIFRRGHPKSENEYHNPKFVDYLVNEERSARILINPKYEEVFGKYRLHLRPDGQLLDPKDDVLNRQDRQAENNHSSGSLDSSVSPVSQVSDQFLKKSDDINQRDGGNCMGVIGMMEDLGKQGEIGRNILAGAGNYDPEGRNSHRRITIRTDRNSIENRYRGSKVQQQKSRGQQPNSIFDEDIDEFGPDYEQDFYQDYYRNYKMPGDYGLDNDIDNSGLHYQSVEKLFDHNPNGPDGQYNVQDDNDGSLSPIGENRNFIDSAIFHEQGAEKHGGKDHSESRLSNQANNSSSKNTSEFLFELQDDINKEDGELFNSSSSQKDDKANSPREDQEHRKQMNLQLDVMDGEKDREGKATSEIRREPEGEILDQNNNTVAKPSASGTSSQKHQPVKIGDRPPQKEEEEEEEDNYHHNQMGYQQLMQDKKSEKTKRDQQDFEIKIAQKRLNNGSVTKGNKFLDAMNVNPLTSAKLSAISYGSPKSSPKGMDKFKETQLAKGFVPVRAKRGPVKDGAQAQFKSIGEAPSSQNAEMYERFSNSSSDMPLSLDNEDLAKDCGIFSIDLNQQPHQQQRSISQPTFKQQDDCQRKVCRQNSGQSAGQSHKPHSLMKEDFHGGRRKSFDDQDKSPQQIGYSKILKKGENHKTPGVSSFAGSLSAHKSNSSKNQDQEYYNQLFKHKLEASMRRQNSQEKQKPKTVTDNMVEKQGHRASGSQSAEKQAYSRTTSEADEGHISKVAGVGNGKPPGTQSPSPISTSKLEIEKHNLTKSEFDQRQDENAEVSSCDQQRDLDPDAPASGQKIIGTKRAIDPFTGQIEGSTDKKNDKTVDVIQKKEDLNMQDAQAQEHPNPKHPYNPLINLNRGSPKSQGSDPARECRLAIVDDEVQQQPAKRKRPDEEQQEQLAIQQNVENNIKSKI